MKQFGNPASTLGFTGTTLVLTDTFFLFLRVQLNSNPLLLSSPVTFSLSLTLLSAVLPDFRWTRFYTGKLYRCRVVPKHSGSVSYELYSSKNTLNHFGPTTLRLNPVKLRRSTFDALYSLIFGVLEYLRHLSRFNFSLRSDGVNRGLGTYS